ncbi:ATP-binding protein [Cereibacter sphaeroides]|uniref:sensor histidine kinase n=1 Tax=Cereibacter sphaeroides TaxID=1063 RepID=UPI001F293019|nr:histidine kinase dimerization/phosphoacceptor domain -containing protein [Cereibacter sphaeroides]MCE6949745.1 ATP-binding protein [Cereibacter sphaeroides]
MAAGIEQSLLDFLQEPIFLLTPQGRIMRTNAAALRLVGGDRTGEDLGSSLETPPDELRAWLRRCSGTSSPVAGQLLFRQPEGGTRCLRVQGARLREAGGQVLIAVRCTVAEADRFSLLKKEVAQLNAEAHARRQRQSLLEEALHRNTIMLRELNHRVKNNIQLMVGLFSAAIRETGSKEVKDVLQAANQRLLAVGAAQALMYETQQVSRVSSAAFLEALTRTLSVTLGPEVRLEVSATEGQLTSDATFPLALILNELVTNAVKHGLRGGAGAVRIVLDVKGDEFTLIVQDDGPGIATAETGRRSSGLGLVRGLCRQLGAELRVENHNGARIIVRFTDCCDEARP